MNIGIIRCHSYSDNCPAGSCLKAIRASTGKFEQHQSPVLVGIDTCGGCARGKGDRVAAKAEKLRKLGAEVIHLGNCLVKPCPYRETFIGAIEDLGLRVVSGTH